MPDWLYNWHLTVLTFWHDNPIAFWGFLCGGVLLYVAVILASKDRR